jgi:hypothetical protein
MDSRSVKAFSRICYQARLSSSGRVHSWSSDCTHSLQTKTKCIAVFILLHLLLLYLLLLQGSDNPLVFARKRDICAHVVACTTSKQPKHFQCQGIQSPIHPQAVTRTCDLSQI